MDYPPTKILVVDDEPSVRSAINDYLTAEGYEVLEAGDGIAMRRVLAEHDAAIVLLDVMLPGESGLSLAQSLAHREDLGVIMISALGTAEDRIAGLEFGADDYLPKPIEPRELLARIRALQRRFKGSTQTRGAAFEFAGWHLDALRRVIKDSRGVITSLSEGEFGILLAFVEHPQRVLSREELMSLARGTECEAFDRAIDTQVSRIRQKLRLRDGEEIIKTLRGEGYMFMPDVVISESRKSKEAPSAVQGRSDRIKLEALAREAFIDGKGLELTYSEFAILSHLTEAGGGIVLKNDLSILVLGRPWRSFERSLDVHVSNLRNKLSNYPGLSIETVRRVGYKLIVEAGAVG